MRKWQIVGMLIVGLAGAHGALAQKVTMEFDQNVDFSKFKTFAIRNGELNSKNPALNSDLVKKQIEADIEKGLTAKGLTEVSGRADINVVYRFGAARKDEIETYPAGWYGWGTRVVRVPYAEGTLVIDLRDPSTRSLVWRAISSEEKKRSDKDPGKVGRHGEEVVREVPAEEVASAESRRGRGRFLIVRLRQTKPVGTTNE